MHECACRFQATSKGHVQKIKEEKAPDVTIWRLIKHHSCQCAQDLPQNELRAKLGTSADMFNYIPWLPILHHA